MAFASQIITWQHTAGRHDLPWQNTQDPYKIWLSEIMLQQTQVVTVIGYYHRFLARFPDIATLASASQDEVMPYWAGLGYYARARNLHKCAQALVAEWAGRFPPTAELIATLPGIGPSTAAAIAAFAYGEQSPIMDGNVKRVFTRHFGIAGDPSKRPTEQKLWALAHAQVDHAAVGALDMPAYTQGLMDLGATLCTRRQPACSRCPIQPTCIAARDGRQHELPTPKVKKVAPQRQATLMLVYDGQSLLMQQRPSSGIWGGLWSLPECDENARPTEWAQACGLDVQEAMALATFEHVFTHFRLSIQPWMIRVKAAHTVDAPLRWFPKDALASVAAPAPVRKLLDGLMTDDLLSA